MVDRTGAVGQPDGTVLYTREVGRESPSVIFPSAGVLDETFRDLGEQSHVIFYDPRHLGRSRPAGARWDLSTDVADLAAVRWAFVVKDALLMDSLYLVGWSYMGPVVTQYAIENPTQVSGIVLLGSIGPTRASHNVDWGRGAGQDSLGLELLRIMQARGEDRSDPITYCRLKWEIEILHPRMSNPEVLTDANMDLCRIQTGQYMDWESHYDRSIASLGNWDFTAAAQQYRGRVLVIHGTDDPVPIEAAVSWTTAFPNARILQVENAGQLPWLEQPDLVRRALQSFFAGQWPQGAVQGIAPQP
jgi:pimeloyl-ACP methyl ester carboxylesterase